MNSSRNTFYRFSFLKSALTVIALTSFVFIGCGRDLAADPDNSAASDSTASTAADSTAKADSLAAAEKERSEAKAVPVEITFVRCGEVCDYILQNSTVDTEKGVEVFSRLNGVVVGLNVEEGTRVNRGEALCCLEDDDYRLARDKAKVIFEKRQAEFERFKNMHDKGLVSTEQLEDASFILAQARIDWEQAELDLKRTRIKAPIAGVVTDRHIRLGERVTTSEPLFRVVEMEDKIAVVHIPEREIGRIRRGQRAYLTTDNLQDMRFEAGIKRVSPAVDAQSGTFKVTVGVNDPQDRLRPGMFISVHIVTETHDNALLIPKSAVIYDNGQPHAFFVEQDTLARRVRLDKGFSNENYMEVLTSVNENDRVIVVGQNGLKDGVRIRIVSSLLDENEQIASKDTILGENTL
jgi:membrane fusion protein (multidrug efflux system)